MADKVTFELVTPDQMVLSVDADMVTLPGLEGDMGILPGHAPLITALRAGVIEVEGSGDGASEVFVASGFAEIAGDRLTVLAEDAVPVADLDRTALEQRIQNTREDLEDAKDDEERRVIEARLTLLEDMLAATR